MHQVVYEPYVNLSLMIFRRTVYGMAVCVKRILISPVDMLVDTVSNIQKEMAILREENRLLRTPATSQVVQVPLRAARMTTKVPRFD